MAQHVDVIQTYRPNEGQNGLQDVGGIVRTAHADFHYGQLDPRSREMEQSQGGPYIEKCANRCGAWSGVFSSRSRHTIS